MKYSIISSDSQHELEEVVTRRLGMGWTVSGSLVVTEHHYERDGYSHCDRFYYQPMTLTKSATDEEPF